MMPTLVVLAAGMATRFDNSGSSIKALAIVWPGIPLIEYILYDWKMAGGKDAVVVVREETLGQFQKSLGSRFHGLRIDYAFQKILEVKPRGTVDALLCGASVAKDDIIACNGDDIYGKTAYSTILQNISQETDIVTLGYLMKNCVPKKQGEGVSRAVMESGPKGKISCREFEKVTCRGDKIMDLDSGSEIDGNAGSSMNILFCSRKAIETIRRYNSAFHTRMLETNKKAEYTFPKMLNDVSPSLRCNIVSFEKSVPYGVTRKEDILQIEEKIKKDYPSDLWVD